MNYHSIKKIAAATSIIADQFGGSVDIFPLIKALYLADRVMLKESGFTITGDYYVSMPNGPVLSEAYDLIAQKYRESSFQNLWNDAFCKTGNAITRRGDINTGCLSPLEVKTIREQANHVKTVFESSRRLADWIHSECPEWEDPGRSSKRISIAKIAAAVGFDDEVASEIEKENLSMSYAGDSERPCDTLLLAN